MGVYENLKIIDELTDRIYSVLQEEGFMANIIDGFVVSFYEDDEDKRSVSISVKFDNSDIVTMFNILEKIKEVTGADDIFFSAKEGDYIEEIELIFNKPTVQQQEERDYRSVIIPTGISFYGAEKKELNTPKQKGEGFCINGITEDGKLANIVIEWGETIEIKSKNPMVIAVEVQK